ncbi:MAG TPA: thiamine pyrophosphate-binding protein [Acidimicrobiales bacterium]|nr:thiamine pyrophosphate-binding protein [Acidimicrobiales bacterium]
MQHAPAEPVAPTGAEVLAEMLAAYGVTHLFMVPAVLRRTMAELERRTSIARIHTHGEKAAAYMADGYARAARRPGVCAAQVVGALNLAAGLREPWLAHSPVIAFTGGRDPATKFRPVYQEVDDLPAFEPVTKLNATIDDVARVPDMVSQAFRVATSGCPGPVHLQLRGNEAQIDAERAEMGPLVDARFATLPPFRPVADDGAIREALGHLRAARRPVLVAGGGVVASGAARELVALAEGLALPVATSLNGKEVIAGSHPLAVGVVGAYSRASANQVVDRADLVFFVGTETGSMTTHSWRVPEIGTPALQLDIEPTHLGRNYPLLVALAGDAKATLARMLELAGDETPARDAWLEEVRELCASWRREQAPLLASEEAPTRPERLCAELAELVEDDAIVVVDTGHAGIWMGAMFDVRSPDQRYLRSCGHLGWAFPAGLGARCARPDRPVLVFTGDAGFWYHIAELETAVRWGIDTVTVVNNNSAGNQSKRGFERAYDGQPTERSRELWTFTDVDFARLAEDVGAFGVRVDKPGDLAGAIARARASGRPAVVDVRTDCEILAPTPWTPAPR